MASDGAVTKETLTPASCNGTGELSGAPQDEGK